MFIICQRRGSSEQKYFRRLTERNELPVWYLEVEKIWRWVMLKLNCLQWWWTALFRKKSERSNNQNNTFTFEKFYIFNGLLRGIVNWIVEFMIWYSPITERQIIIVNGETSKIMLLLWTWLGNISLVDLVTATSYFRMFSVQHTTCLFIWNTWLLDKIKLLLTAMINKVNYNVP